MGNQGMGGGRNPFGGPPMSEEEKKKARERRQEEQKRRQEAAPARIGRKKKRKGVEASSKLPQSKCSHSLIKFISKPCLKGQTEIA